MGKWSKLTEKSIKLETSPKVTKSKRSLHWCRSISKKLSVQVLLQYQSKVITLSGRRFITVSGVFITLSGTYYIIGHFLLHYRAHITVSGVYYIIGWYSACPTLTASFYCHGIRDRCMLFGGYYQQNYRHRTDKTNCKLVEYRDLARPFRLTRR